MYREHYVYELIDPRDGVVFYVGKGKAKRYTHHEKEARKGKRSRKCALIRDIIEAGLSYDVRIVSRHSTAAAAYAAEAVHIEKLGLCALTNVTPGAGGYEIYKASKALTPQQIVRKAASSIRSIMLWGSLGVDARIGGVEVLQDALTFCRELRDKAGAEYFDKLVKPHQLTLKAMF